MPYTTASDGVRLYYETAGRRRGDDPVLIFVHGWCCNLEHWAPVADAFAATHRVVSLDLRGHGRSDAPPKGYSGAKFAGDVAAVAEAARVTDAVVIGHSMGARVALQTAKQYRDLVRAFVMADVSVGGYVPPAQLAEHPDFRLVADDGYAGAEVLYRRFFNPPDSAFADRVIGEAMRTPLHVVVEARRALMTTNSAALAKGVRQPMLFINASFGNTRTADEIHAMLPHAEFAQVAMSGHFVQLEVPDQVEAMIRRFLGGLG
jgi:pimeloyl-ACP methyl ester carboxylesterase